MARRRLPDPNQSMRSTVQPGRCAPPSDMAPHSGHKRPAQQAGSPPYSDEVVSDSRRSAIKDWGFSTRKNSISNKSEPRGSTS